MKNLVVINPKNPETAYRIFPYGVLWSINAHRKNYLEIVPLNYK